MSDPAVLLYTGDFMSGTLFFTDDQVGKYFRALCAQHHHGHLTEQQLESIIKGDNGVRLKFTSDENGLLYNVRMDKEIKKRQRYSELQAGRVNKRWNKNKGEVYHGNTTVIPPLVLPERNRDRNKDSISFSSSSVGVQGEGITAVSLKTLFDAWWLSYPKKDHQEVAFLQFEKLLKESIATPFQLMNGCQRYNAYCMLKFEDYPHSQYIKFPENWLKDSCWTIDWKKSADDEIKRQNVAGDKKLTGGRAVYEYERAAASKYENL